MELSGTQDVFYSRSSSAPLSMMACAEGIWFWDEEGKAYIDASSGPMVSALGHCNRRVIDAMVRQARTLDYAYTLVAHNRPNLEYARRPTTMGAVVPPPSYFRAIRDICTRHGVFPIFDEVLCGAGRTGQFIAAHHWPEALPDIIVQAKGIGAGYAPLGAMWVSATHADQLSATAGFDFIYSYNANPIACAVGLAVLDEFERLELCANATARGAQLRRGSNGSKLATRSSATCAA